MTPLSPLIDERVPTGLGGRFYGVYPARVARIDDPDGQGRVQIELPWAADEQGAPYAVWARLATLMAGPDRGSWFVPDPDDEVLVAFEGGEPARPYVVGMLWNGQDAPPVQMDAQGRNERKVLRSRRGVQITLDDAEGRERLVLETPGGQRVTLSDEDGSVTLEDRNGNTVALEPAGITIETPGRVSISAGSEIELSAALVTSSAALTEARDTFKTGTALITSVVGTSYTPGAGNIW
jgi:uncharacterized protein involved in type VI secretion and phage assembly